MTCREFAEFMADYLSDELPAEPRQQFERHLSRCPNCTRYLEIYRQSIALGKRAFEDENATLPEDVPEDLVKAILMARHQTPSD